MEIKKHLLPIFFIIVFVLGIYFILFKKKKEYYENQILSNFSNHVEHFENNQNIKSMINGYWTTMNTTVDGNKLSGILYKIVLNNENPIDGYVSTVKTNDLNKELIDKIPIVFISNNLIIAEKMNKESTGSETKNTIEFKWNQNDQNPLKSDNIPMMTVTTTPSSKYNEPILSFKIKNPNIVGGKLSRIISSKHFLNPSIQEKYDLNTYNKYLKYKYPNNPFIVEYNDVNEDQKKSFYELLNNLYHNQLYFCYQREYATIDNESIITPLSKKYNLTLLKDKKYFSKIILKNIEEENRLNNISKPFVIKNTIIYFYKKFNNKLSFYDVKYFPSTFNSNTDLNFKNQFGKEFDNIPIKVIKIEDVKAKDVSQLNLTLLNKYVMTSDKMEITILPSDIEKIIQ